MNMYIVAIFVVQVSYFYSTLLGDFLSWMLTASCNIVHYIQG